jgi:hypothetical protein
VKKIILILLAGLWLPALAQDRYLHFDSTQVVLNGVVTDTLWVSFPSGGTPREISIINSTTPPKPTSPVRVSGSVQIWLSQSIAAGNADSMRARYHPIYPLSGALSGNDSTFLVGTATAPAAIRSPSNYYVGLFGDNGFGVVISQENLTVDTSTVTIVIQYSQ